MTGTFQLLPLRPHVAASMLWSASAVLKQRAPHCDPKTAPCGRQLAAAIALSLGETSREERRLTVASSVRPRCTSVGVEWELERTRSEDYSSKCCRASLLRRSHGT